MKPYFAILAAAALFGGSTLASAQQQYDSLGSPTPAPNQKASPSTPAPNIPKPGSPKSNDDAAKGNSMSEPNNKTNAGTKGTSYATGAGADKMPSGTPNSGMNSGTTSPTDPTTNGGATPNGLTPE